MFISTKRNGLVTGQGGGHGRARRGRLRGPRGWAALGAVAVTASSAAGVMVLEAGTVFAPEPVVTTQPLTGTNGATPDVVTMAPPPGYYVWPDGVARPYMFWPTTFGWAPNLAVGIPCSGVVLPVDAVATKQIKALGNFRICA